MTCQNVGIDKKRPKVCKSKAFRAWLPKKGRFDKVVPKR